MTRCYDRKIKVLVDILQPKAHDGEYMETKADKKFYTFAEIAKMNKVTTQAVHKKIKKLGIPYETFGKTNVVEKVHVDRLKFLL